MTDKWVIYADAESNAENSVAASTLGVADAAYRAVEPESARAAGTTTSLATLAITCGAIMGPMKHEQRRPNVVFCTNLRECREAQAFIEKQMRKLELREALEDAFRGGGKVFDDAFWVEVKQRRRS